MEFSRNIPESVTDSIEVRDYSEESSETLLARFKRLNDKLYVLKQADETLKTIAKLEGERDIVAMSKKGEAIKPTDDLKVAHDNLLRIEMWLGFEVTKDDLLETEERKARAEIDEVRAVLNRKGIPNPEEKIQLPQPAATSENENPIDDKSIDDALSQLHT